MDIISDISKLKSSCLDLWFDIATLIEKLLLSVVLEGAAIPFSWS